LLEAIGESVIPRRAAWQKARLEKALDTILADRGIAAWQYQELNMTQWWRSTVLLEPPEIIRATYQRLTRHETPLSRALPAAPTLGEQLKRRRLVLGLSQIQAAEMLGISQAYLSLVERGAKTHLGAALHQKVQTWLGEADEAADHTAVLLPPGLSQDDTT
jgi:DNA-binding transcriptional regulator YiaG